MATISVTGGILPAPGDTLTSISIQFWGTPEVADDLLHMNRHDPRLVAGGVNSPLPADINMIPGVGPIGLNVPPLFVNHFETLAVQTHGINARVTNQDLFRSVLGETTTRPPPQQAPVQVVTPTPLAETQTPTTPTITRDNAAFQATRALLERYGLGGLEEFVWQMFVEGATPTQIDLAIRDTEQFKSRFPVIGVFEQRGIALSPEQVLEYERGVVELMMTANMPRGFYDTAQEAQELLIGGRTLVEVSQILDLAGRAESSVDPATRSGFQRIFGASTPQAIAAYAFDRNKSIERLQLELNAAEISGESIRFGVDTNRSRIFQLAGAGFDQASSRQGFGQISRLSPLFQESISERRDLSETNEGIDEIFFGLGDAVSQRLRERQASQAGGGRFTRSARGLVGIS